MSPPGTAKKICAGTPRITRGMGTNITLDPGEKVGMLHFIMVVNTVVMLVVVPAAWAPPSTRGRRWAQKC